METAYYTSIIKIIKQDAIVDAGSTGHFFLPGTPVKNVQPASKYISVNLIDGSKLRSTHTCNIDIAGIPEKANREHIVPGLAHASIISISVLCNAGCKVQYNENICSVYYNRKLVYKVGREPQTRLWILPLQ